MKISQLRELIKEVIKEINELNTSGTGSSFSPGLGAQYSTPFAFGKKGKENNATKYAKKLGYKQIKTKKRPYSTKLIDYLNNENIN